MDTISLCFKQLPEADTEYEANGACVMGMTKAAVRAELGQILNRRQAIASCIQQEIVGKENEVLP